MWVLIGYSNGYWNAEGIEGLRIHDIAHGTVEEGGTGVAAYERLQERVMDVYLKPGFPDETLIPMWLHTNSAQSRLQQAMKEEEQRARAA
jgi:hypothetical protein